MSAGSESEELRALTFVRRSLLRKNERIRDLNQKLNALQEENDKLKWKCSDQDKEIERLNNELSLAAQGSQEESFVSSQETHPDKNNDELHTDFDPEQENDMCGESSSADIFPYKDIALKREFSEDVQNHTDRFHPGGGQQNDFNASSSAEDQHHEHSVVSNTNNMQIDPHTDLAGSLLGQLPSESDGAKASSIGEISAEGVDHLRMVAAYGTSGAPGHSKRARTRSRMGSSGPYSGLQKDNAMFRTSQRGAPMLVLDGFVYNRHRANRSGTVHWVCKLSRQPLATRCHGAVTTVSEVDATVVGRAEHNHAPDARNWDAQTPIRRIGPETLQLYGEVLSSSNLQQCPGSDQELVIQKPPPISTVSP